MPSRPESMCLLQSTQPPRGSTMPVIYRQGLKTQSPSEAFSKFHRVAHSDTVRKPRRSQRARVFILLTTFRKAA